jgi:predicted DNA repair protein MutK
MSIGLIGLLDDVAGIAKAAAASLDDVASQAARAGAKAAGVVIDDTAVTPGYVIGFSPKRELPIVGKIAAGSLRNKLLVLLPAALALSYFLPCTTAAMIWVGGGIILHGVAVYGPPAIGHAVKAAAEAVAHAVPPIAGILEWVVEAFPFDAGYLLRYN